MTGSFRVAGFAAAVAFVASLFAAPALAADGGNVETLPVLTAPATEAAAGVSASHFHPQMTNAVVSTFQPQGAAAPAVAAEPEADAPVMLAPPAPVPAKARPLRDLVLSFVDYGDQDSEEECLAKAVYFEARGETIEGQLAVAEVVLNRAASGIYPPSVCGVVTQRAQFSFIRDGRFPPVDRASECWHKALAIADIATKRLAKQIGSDVLWYHADYVAPSWGRRLNRVVQIGTHIFYS